MVEGRSKGRVLVMKCNENDNLPCCAESLSVMLDGVVVVVAKGKNIARTWLFKG